MQTASRGNESFYHQVADVIPGQGAVDWRAFVSVPVTETVPANNQFVQSIIIFVFNVRAAVQQIVAECVQLSEVYSGNGEVARFSSKETSGSSSLRSTYVSCNTLGAHGLKRFYCQETRRKCAQNNPGELNFLKSLIKTQKLYIVFGQNV